MRLSLLRTAQSALLLIALLAPSMASAQDITTGLIGHWKLDETSGTTAADSAGSNNGTMQGGITGTSNTTNGKLNSALTFDGIGDYIDLNNSTSDFSFIQNTLNFTISGWVKINDLSKRKVIIADTITNADKGFFFMWETIDSVRGDHALRFAATNGGGFAPVINTHSDNNVTINDNNWHHVAVVGLGNNVTFYVDGAPKTTTVINAFSSLSTGNSSRSVLIGGGNAASPPLLPFDGGLDDIRIYNRALTAADIQELYKTLHGNIRYNDESEAVEYNNGASWIHTGLGSYSPNGVAFDGTSAWLQGTDLTDDSKRITGSFWFRRNTADTSANQNIYHRSDGSLDITISSDGDGGDIVISAENEAGTTILNLSNTSNLNDGEWHHVLFSVDMSDTGKRHLYIDGVSDLSVGTYTDDILDLAGGADLHAVGANSGGSDFFHGALADYWFESGTYTDLSISANRQKFISDNGVPMYLGTDGSLPFGKSPDIFLSGATDDWHTNKGTSGGLTENGTLTDASSQPGKPDLDIGLSSGLVAHWKLDETSGTVIADSSGNGNTGTASPGIPTIDSLAGKVGNSLNFNAPEYIDVGQMSAMIGQSAFTMAFWMRLDAIPTVADDNDAPLIQHDDFDNQYGCRFDGASQTFNCYLENGGVTHGAGVFNSGNITTGTWYHIVYTYDGSGGTSAQSKFYIDGTVRSTNNHTGSLTIPNLTNSMRIASLQSAETGYVDGRMDDVRVYNRALNSLEIAALYGGGCDDPTNIKGTIIYNSDDKVMQYCNGTEYVAMGPVGGTGGAGCASPSGSAGEMLYNEDFAVLQYCNNEDWVAVGKTFDESYNRGMVAHWKLDETSGDVIADSSGKGRSGTWRDGINDDVSEETTTGQVSNAIEFDGNNDRIFMGTNPNLLEGQTEGSLCLWMNHTGSISSDRALVAKFDANSTGFNGIYMWVDDTAGFSGRTDTISFSVNTTANTNGRVEGSSSLVTPGVWDHYCATFKGDTYIRLYKNGTLDTENTNSIVSSFVTAPTVHFRLGNDESSSRGFNGSLDDVRIYHRVLESDEISALYNATK